VQILVVVVVDQVAEVVVLEAGLVVLV